MSSTPDWLERLERATDYRELQEVFGEIVQQARSTQDNRWMADRIDEAIRRLTQERARDETELLAHQEQYEAFKAGKSGVVGWFKRHVPFTATRREELEHRDAVSDQQAEILADNFVIARAQMVKEQVLTADGRKLGARVADWRQQLATMNSPAAVQACGVALQQLAVEFRQADEFLSQLKIDVEAFAKAPFSDKQDRQRRDADLEAGRRELELLVAENQEKRELRKSGLRQLGLQIARELMGTDARFRQDAEQFRQVTAVHDQGRAASQRLDEFLQVAKQQADLNKRLQGLPEETRRLEELARQARRQEDELSHQRSRHAQAFDPLRARYEAAQRELDQTKIACEAAQRLYAAYQREQGAPAEAIHVEASSPVEQEYLRLQNQLRQVEARLQSEKPAYESARREIDGLESKLTAAVKKCGDLQRQIQELGRQSTQLQQDIQHYQQRSKPAIDSLQHAVLAYLGSVRRDGLPTAIQEDAATASRPWLVRGSLTSALADVFARPAEARLQADGLRWADGLRQWLAADVERLKRDQAQIDQRWRTAWMARCKQLLDAALAQELCQDPPQIAETMPS